MALLATVAIAKLTTATTPQEVHTGGICILSGNRDALMLALGLGLRLRLGLLSVSVIIGFGFGFGFGTGLGLGLGFC